MRALLAALWLTALSATAAFAADGGKEQVHLTKADQAAATRVVARRADLGTAQWQGGLRKPDLLPLTCANFHPKQSDLVLTGAAESDWEYQGLRNQTVAQVLRTKAMVAADWRRTVVAPAAIPCLRTQLLKQLGSGVTFVSFRRIIFPPVATNARAYVLLLDVKTTTGKARVAVEVVLIAKGRTEVTIVSTAPNAVQTVIAQGDAQLARTLLARAA
jgi:hypothetical protein